MRALLAVALLSMAGLASGCCKKSEPTTTTTAPPATTTPAPGSTLRSGQADPVACRGMDTLTKCKECCDTRYWNVSFAGNKCSCIKK